MKQRLNYQEEQEMRQEQKRRNRRERNGKRRTKNWFAISMDLDLDDKKGVA